jgi:hypothetical protein
LQLNSTLMQPNEEALVDSWTTVVPRIAT